MLESSSCDGLQNDSLFSKRRRVDEEETYVLSDVFEDVSIMEIEETLLGGLFDDFDAPQEINFTNQRSYSNLSSTSRQARLHSSSNQSPFWSCNSSNRAPLQYSLADPLTGNSSMAAAIIDISDAKPSVLSKRRFSHLVGKGRAAFSITCSLPTVVPTSDIRQRYMGIWGNIFNEYDLPHLASFLDQHTRGDVTMTVRFPQGRAAIMPSDSPPDFASSSSASSFDLSDSSNNGSGRGDGGGVQMIQTTTKQQLMLHWAAVMFMSPDQVTRYDCIRIKPRTDGREGSVVRCRLGVRGTLPFQSSELDIIQEIQQTIHHKANTNSNSSNAGCINDDDFAKLLSSCSCPSLPLVTHPKRLFVGGTLTFILDVDKRIEKIDCYLKPDPVPGYFDETR